MKHEDVLIAKIHIGSRYTDHMVRPNQYFRQLLEIHAAPPEHRKELIKRMIDESWTVEHTRAEVKKLKPKKALKPIPNLGSPA